MGRASIMGRASANWEPRHCSSCSIVKSSSATTAIILCSRLPRQGVCESALAGLALRLCDRSFRRGEDAQACGEGMRLLE
eukprot:6211033-Pleurochrysis_carterae.AAC.1